MRDKIGILLPKSEMFPTLARDFMNGIRLSLNQSDFEVQTPDLLIEGIGNAGGEVALRAAERLILQENADLILSFCGFQGLEGLTGFFDAYKKPLIHLDLGGNLLKSAHKSPYVLHHSLNLCQSAYTAGKYAAKKYGKKAALACSFYDAGYQLSYSFVKGFTDNGGEMVYNYVAPMDYKNESYDALLKGLEETKPDVVFTLFSFKEGAKVSKILANSALNGSMPFVSVPLMNDEYFNKENYGINGMVSVASWSFDDKNKSMQDFLKAYRKEYADDPNIFGLLGFEAGLLYTESLKEAGSIPVTIGAYFENKTIETPRGNLSFNTYYDSFMPELLVRSFQFNQIKYHNTVIDKLESNSPDSLYQECEELPYSGWQNPYICT